MVAEASTSTAYPADSLPGTPAANDDPSSSGLPPANGDGTVRLSDLITQVLPLGFGKCKLQVQVPEKSKHLQTVEDLVGKKIATSFDGIAGQFFKELDEKASASASASGKKAATTKIEYVGGSVEAACALGVADGIVDLVGELCFTGGVLSSGSL
jgi:ATP phosphoribosyltransferase